MTLSLFPNERPHTCHARDCNAPVPPELLMCLVHWRRVPRPIQRAVWAGYRPGQCDDKQLNETWLRAANAAIGYVAKLEGKPLRPEEVKRLEELGYK